MMCETCNELRFDLTVAQNNNDRLLEENEELEEQNEKLKKMLVEICEKVNALYQLVD